MENKDTNSSFAHDHLQAEIRIAEFLDYLKELDHLIKKASKDTLAGGSSIRDEDELYVYKEPFAGILYSTVVIGAVIFLEQELADYSHSLKKVLSLPILPSDLNGSTLERFKKYSSKLAKLKLNLDGSLWQDIQSIWEIRNCLVHRNGYLSNGPNENKIHDFGLRYNLQIIEFGKISLSVNACEKIIDIIGDFLNLIYRTAKNTFKTSQSDD